MHFVGTDFHAAVSVDGDAAAYRVIRRGGAAVENALPLTTPS